jgi:hypothetical protein
MGRGVEYESLVVSDKAEAELVGESSASLRLQRGRSP